MCLTSTSPPDQQKLETILDEIDRWALAKQAAKSAWLATLVDENDFFGDVTARKRYTDAGARLVCACRDYEDLTGREIEDVRVEPDAELPMLEQVDAMLRAAERRDRQQHLTAMRRRRRRALDEIERARKHGPLRGYHRDLAEQWGVQPSERREPTGPKPACAAQPRTSHAAAPGHRRTSASSRTSSADPGEEGPSPSPRLCAAPWCEHVVYGPAQQRFCRTERCDQARAAERKRDSRARVVDLSALERAQQLADARAAHYVGDEAFSIGLASGRDSDKHALSFLWAFALADGSDPGEYIALQLRACRCNGHHIDGGVVGCFKCGLSREAVPA